MIAAVIVLYRPDLALLDRLLRSVEGQVDKAFVVDNTPGSSKDCTPQFGAYGGEIVYVPLEENKGIATAHNVGIQKAMDAGCSHVLLLDQDSALPEGMVSKLLASERELLAAGKKVAAVGPVFVEEKTGEISRTVRHRWFRIVREVVDPKAAAPVETDYLIASGSLIRTSVLREIGGMMDELFIDWVDIEWGLRARARGFLSYLIPAALMRHSVGDISVQIWGKSLPFHSDLRNCYIVRNSTYLLRVKSMGWQWRILTVPRIPHYIYLYIRHSKDKRKSLRLLRSAFWDGVRGKLGRLD